MTFGQSLAFCVVSVQENNNFHPFKIVGRSSETQFVFF